MLIVGDLSGIQDYLFDIGHEGGGQARRLRARSFFIQMLAECAALRVRRALGWAADTVVFSGAGKFMLSGPTTSDAVARVQIERGTLNCWLLTQTGGHLKLALVADVDAGSPVDQYERAMLALQKEKLRPWVGIGASDGRWNPDGLILDPLDRPCAICRHRRAAVDERDRDTGAVHRVCVRCRSDSQVGQRLPRMKWIVIRETPAAEDMDVAGLGVGLSADPPAPPESGDLAVANLQHPDRPPDGWPRERILARQLARHIPSDRDGAPLDFTELAGEARGDKLLGVLKMDGDSLGVKLDALLRDAVDLENLARFSRRLDEFMAGTLDAELQKSKWSKTYTIFAGGDDLLLVGPWHLLFAYAAHVRDLFMAQFGAEGLTISAGLSFFRPTRPILRAAEEAERLLEAAKTTPAPNAHQPKDQMASFGQIWKWTDHQGVLSSGEQLARWIDGKQAKRGWLFTLLELVELRHGSGADTTDRLRATARLDYHVTRNYPTIRDRDPEKVALREWADRLVRDFDDAKDVQTTFLPAIVRYALTATRDAAEED